MAATKQWAREVKVNSTKIVAHAHKLPLFQNGFRGMAAMVVLVLAAASGTLFAQVRPPHWRRLIHRNLSTLQPLGPL